MLALDALEQGFEVSFAESLAAFALDHFEEERRSVPDWAREDLQQVAVVIAVDEDVQGAQAVEVLVDAGGAIAQRVVVGARGGEEFDPAIAHVRTVPTMSSVWIAMC